MSTFLTRLAQRSTESMPVVQPRPISRYESVRGASMFAVPSESTRDPEGISTIETVVEVPTASHHDSPLPWTPQVSTGQRDTSNPNPSTQEPGFHQNQSARVRGERLEVSPSPPPEQRSRPASPRAEPIDPSPAPRPRHPQRTPESTDIVEATSPAPATGMQRSDRSPLSTAPEPPQIVPRIPTQRPVLQSDAPAFDQTPTVRRSEPSEPLAERGSLVPAARRLAEQESQAPSRSADSSLPEGARHSLARPAERNVLEPHLQPERREAETTIHVSIGRIEIRAAPPPASAPRPRAAPPVMGLDEYLRRRNEGVRR